MTAALGGGGFEESQGQARRSPGPAGLTTTKFNTAALAAGKGSPQEEAAPPATSIATTAPAARGPVPPPWSPEPGRESKIRQGAIEVKTRSFVLLPRVFAIGFAFSPLSPLASRVSWSIERFSRSARVFAR